MERTGRKDELIALDIALIKRDRQTSLERIKKLRALMTKKEWNSFYQEMVELETLEPIISRLYEQEKDYPKLLEYIKKRPEHFLHYKKLLYTHFPQEALELHEKQILDFAKGPSNRNNYKRIVDEIDLMYASQNGKEEAYNLVLRFFELYPAKRALKEELYNSRTLTYSKI